MNYLIVATGGAIGAACRYGISNIEINSKFPFATFITNLIGAFIIGFIVGIAEENTVSDKVILFIKTGFCGGFTTFSTFSLEAVMLLSDEKYFVGIIYIFCSLVFCIIGVIAGQVLSKSVV